MVEYPFLDQKREIQKKEKVSWDNAAKLKKDNNSLYDPINNKATVSVLSQDQITWSCTLCPEE